VWTFWERKNIVSVPGSIHGIGRVMLNSVNQIESSGQGLPLKGKGKKKDGNREMRKKHFEYRKLYSADCPVTLGW